MEARKQALADVVASGPAPAVFGWDWSATTHDLAGTGMSVLGMVAEFAGRLGGVEELPGKGLQGWEQSLEVFDGEGFKVGNVYYGGRPDVHVVATSSAAHAAREVVAEMYGAKTARVDTRVDTLLPFEALTDLLERAAASYGSLITRVESSVRGESKGRTVYLGAPSSAIRVRVYEKWLESPGQYVEGTNRVEVQLRPGSRVKQLVSTWTPMETFCASRTTRALAEELADDLVPTRSLHVARGVPDLEKALAAMGNQYGRRAREHVERSRGEVDGLLEYLIERGGETRWETADRVAAQEAALVASGLRASRAEVEQRRADNKARRTMQLEQQLRAMGYGEQVG